ncbi:hypothetical protein T484DRAFT_1816150 [Baffinella frigidus]|nr:hypothetical protein T484DRAFT_1816150 [Cryptophyta sp. CCMP2293]
MQEEEEVTFDTADIRNGVPPDTLFDLVLMRYSVLLYLSPEDARAALSDVVLNSLAPGGYLVIGDTEMLPDEYEKLPREIPRPPPPHHPAMRFHPRTNRQQQGRNKPRTKAAHQQ